MTQSTFEKYFIPILFVCLIIIGMVWTGKTIYDMVNPPPDKNITFNVVGIVNATNSSIVSIQFECIKYCIDHVVDYTPRKLCLEACEGLGK